MTFAALVLLAVSAVENAAISSPQLGTFFSLPGWMPTSVSSARTPGSCDATNMTRRVDATALAAVNACFEAYCERSYYGFAGQSNVWSVADYGPRCTGADKHQFRFGLPTNVVHFFAYSPDTNRVIETRRFVEWENMKNLGDALERRGSHWYECEPPFEITRPNWWTKDEVLWSSTLFKGLATNYGVVGDPLPVVNWTGAASFVASQGSKKWFDCGLVWSNFESGDLTGWYVAPTRQKKTNVAYDAMKAVEFGEPEFTYGEIGQYVVTSLSVTNKTDDIIGRTVCVTNIEDVVKTNEYAIKLGMRSDMEGFTVLDEIESYLGTIGETNDFAAVSGIDQAGVNLNGDAFVYFNCGKVGSMRTPVSRRGVITTGVDTDKVRRVWTLSNEIVFNMIKDSEGIFRAEPGTGDRQFNTLYIEYVTKSTNITKIVGVEGLTNDTRRLYMDKMAAIGLTLGAMDRSYAHLTTPIPNVVTQYVCSAERHYESSLDFEPTFVWDEGNQQWVSGESRKDFPTLELTEEYDTSHSGGSQSGYNRYIKYETSVSRLFDLSYRVECPETAILLTEDAIQDLFDRLYIRPTSEFDITLEGWSFDPNFGFVLISGKIYVDRDYSHPVCFEEDFGGPQVSNATVFACAKTSVSYEHGNTIGEPTWRHGYRCYPGEFSRTSQSSVPQLWSMYGAACHDGDQARPVSGFLVGYDESHPQVFSSEYKTSKNGFTRATSLFASFENDWDDLKRKCNQMFSAAKDYDPANALVVLTSLEQNIPGALGNVFFPANSVLSCNVHVHTDKRPEFLEGFHGSIINGRAVIDTVYWRNASTGETREESASLPFIIGYWDVSVDGEPEVKEGYYPAEEEFYGAKVNGKIDSWSKVDWNWKALKRTNKQ